VRNDWSEEEEGAGAVYDKDDDEVSVRSNDSDIAYQVTEKEERAKIADDVTKDKDCKKMVKKLLKYG